MVCNQNVPDPNKHERTPDVVRERPCWLSDSWEHVVERRERRRHSHARTLARTQTHTRIRACIQTHSICARTRMCTRACTHAQTHTHTRTQTHTRTHARTHTKTDSHAHTRTHTHTHTHDTHAQAHTHADTHMTRAEGSPPPRVRQSGKGGDDRGWTEERERRGAWGIVSVFPHIQ